MKLDTTNENPLYAALRRFWHPVAYSSDVLDKPIEVTLLGRSLVVARLNGDVRAMDSRCPHKGTNLALGQIVDDTIECPYHGWRFNLNGQCVRTPAREELVDSIRASVQTYAVAEQAGMVWVCLEEPEFAAPEFPELNDPSYRVLQGPTYDWKTSSPRRLENFVDFSHFAYVHDGTIGSRKNPRVNAVDVWREGHVLRFDRSGVKEPGVGLKKKLLGLTEEWIEPVNEYHVTMPHTVHLKRTFPNGKRYVLFMSASPVDEHTTRSFWWQARDFGTEPVYDAFFMDFEAEVLAQDKPIIESQQPVWISLRPRDPSERERPMRDADVVTMEYRRWLGELSMKKEAV
ncbi:aromatic ring-hydroxylating dioxygenase subunit alpha [Pusillimonas sp. DMV24BSW_D]|uniref:aromatic ring-hydroxylating dioxygenase subunit alpha n=1 Tax=Neopusillimonas aestuarii TaxID=2716226 RepID=UPI00140E832B|nr:aromatic ring-hydroxylating dioxygenase subunit alpha [Pusillimonas sp. DMV24BSW_D]QIM49415.1 aromatic ring-hydroxylating dioxygenase subunit alpha [Pusillimonas sp. DMV24BSW_D]